jgi:hypothetical protein
VALNDMTIDDIAEVERLSGQPLADLSNSAAMKGKLMKAIVFVLRRRDNPEFTFEDAGRMTMGEMNEVLGEDPT